MVCFYEWPWYAQAIYCDYQPNVQQYIYTDKCKLLKSSKVTEVYLSILLSRSEMDGTFAISGYTLHIPPKTQQLH